MKTAIYPGSFDPLHKGHIKIIEKALKLFDKVIVLVSNNEDKNNDETLNKRFEETKNKLSSYQNLEVEMNKGLTANWAKDKNIKFLIRSGRNNLDFKYELELAAVNKHINNELETIIIMPELEDIDYSSRLIRLGVK